MSRGERCAACGKPTFAGEDFNGPCVYDTDIACALWQLDTARGERHAAECECDAAVEAADKLTSALRHLLLSRDAAWTGGHDWQEAVDEAIKALGVTESKGNP